MRAPRWARALVRRFAPRGRADEIVGDLDESHRLRVQRMGRIGGTVFTGLEALDMARALLLERRRGGGFSLVDLKLALRLLIKHPGLSFVSTLGMTVAVAIGATSFGVIRGLTSSPLPFEGGERIVTIQNTSQLGFEQERRTHLHDLETWRTVPALDELGAYRIVTRNLFTDDGTVSTARVVEMTASGFRVTGARPLLGRVLSDDDERPGAPPVAVIGEGVWRDRYGRDPDVIGRPIRIGATRHEIVGVMPEAFAFPINNRIWTPFRLRPEDFEVGRAPEIDVFGRLARSATLDQATAQLAAFGERAAAADPERRGHVSTEVFPYSQEFFWGAWPWILYLVELMVSMLLVVIAINVGALIYARTITRMGEIAVRTALGASRSRIVSQLFLEALVISSGATLLGIALAREATRRIGLHVVGSGGEQIPFWWDFGLSPWTLVYGAGLAILAALIVGVVPALGATGRQLRGRLQAAGAGASEPRLGGRWTALIVTQIAVAVAILPLAIGGLSRTVAATPPDDPGALDEILVADLVLDAEVREEEEERLVALRDELVRRLEARPDVARVTPLVLAPWRDPDLRFEIDGGSASTRLGAPDATGSASTGHRVGRSYVPPEYFATLDLDVLAGRPLQASDTESAAPPVVVNQEFVDLVMAGESPVGRRIRFLRSPDPERENLDEAPWQTIVGVVSGPPRAAMASPEAKAYSPVRADDPRAATLLVRVRGAAAGYAGPLRAEAGRLDPMLRLANLESLETVLLGGNSLGGFFVTALAALSLATLLLAVAGLYALMSFTVARRRREIGIRVALGAPSHQLLARILRRAAWQLALGVALGLTAGIGVDRLAFGEFVGRRDVVIVPAVILLMAAVGIAAAWGPARQGLSVQPREALQAE